MAANLEKPPSTNINLPSQGDRIVPNYYHIYQSTTMKKRCVSESVKKTIAARQRWKCANSPGTDIVQGYICPLWRGDDGTFDEAGFEIDHIAEVSVSGDNSAKNLQALCTMCHRVKTRRFQQTIKSVHERQHAADAMRITALEAAVASMTPGSAEENQPEHKRKESPTAESPPSKAKPKPKAKPKVEAVIKGDGPKPKPKAKPKVEEVVEVPKVNVRIDLVQKEGHWSCQGIDVGKRRINKKTGESYVGRDRKIPCDTLSDAIAYCKKNEIPALYASSVGSFYPKCGWNGALASDVIINALENSSGAASLGWEVEKKSRGGGCVIVFRF